MIASAFVPASVALKPFEGLMVVSALGRASRLNEISPMPVGLLLSDDLIFTSRITGTAVDLGLSIKAARTPAGLASLLRETTPRCVILDLSNPGLVIDETVRMIEMTSPEAYLVAYGSHVDTATLRAARAAGCDLVLPRSRFVEDLPQLLPSWFEDGASAPPS
jgi:DNA-binding NarL/FixJ family response regulator